MDPQEFAKPKTSYRKLNVFKKAEAIYDLTYLFLGKHISKKDRTHDQMLQAARSGKQNIVEGRSDSAISAEMEIKLFGVARGSLHELLNDYEDFMRTRNIPIWDMSHPRNQKLREMCKKQNESAFYTSLFPRLNDEELCNLIITLLHQELRMLDSFIQLIKADFLKNGGIKEQMTRARLDYRGKNS